MKFTCKTKNLLRITLLLITLLLMITGCSQKDQALSTTASDLPTYAFKTSTPEAQGVDSEKLVEMFNAISKDGAGIHHVMIIKNGYNIASCDFFPYTKDDLHTLNSVTKSVMSAAIGCAIDDQLISGTDAKMLDFFKSETFENPSDSKANVTLLHLMMMTAGFEWSETGNYGATTDSYTQMKSSTNPIHYLMNKAVINEPGSAFYYNSGLPYLLSDIIKTVSGKKTEDYVSEKIFKPLGINNYKWRIDDQEVNCGGSGLFLDTESLAKIGYLYLNHGDWYGNQIISEDWINTSTQKHIETPNGPAGTHGYGYLWWMNPFDGYSARGYGGQYLFVLPEENMVVVFYSGLSGYQFFKPESLVKDYIIPANLSQDAIAENPESVQELKDLIASGEAIPEAKPIQALPPLATSLFGKTFEVEGDQTVGIDFTKGSNEAVLHWLCDGTLIHVPVGLDDQYRISICPNFLINGMDTPVGFKGVWVNDTTFRMEVVPIEGNSQYIFLLKYNGDTLDAKFLEK